MGGECAEDSWGGDKVLHEDGGEFDKVGGASRTGHIVKLCLANHCYFSCALVFLAPYFEQVSYSG